ncbi:MAG: hypothetical protein LBI58_00845 [Tannerellaceae bacterium]|jgi:hypothetical protein|nr:hypothetical protein [Tannerellaceae bacterium]
MTQGRRQLSAYIFILIFTFFYVNISFFFHSHTINRTTIFHSHFHGSSHTKGAIHTDSELSLITILSVFHSLQAALCFMGAGLFLTFLSVLCIGSEGKTLAVAHGNSFLRAPPALS